MRESATLKIQNIRKGKTFSSKLEEKQHQESKKDEEKFPLNCLIFE